jgi:GNAT superfamily N-acetyltransferase
MAIEVRPVKGFGELRHFVHLPYRLHANQQTWVPPLLLERYIFLNRKLNAFFEHGEAEYFLAWRDGRPVGRITAQINAAFNDQQKRRWGWFGFLELENSPEIAAALLDTATEWLRARGCEKMVGPADFAMNDESGVLIEGYDIRPQIKQPWHPPYYRELMEACGMEKAMDLLMWSLEVENRDQVLPVIWELADKVESEHGIRVRNMERRHLRRELDDFAEVYNAAWADNWDFTPYSKKDLDALAQEMHLVFDPNWAFIAERISDGEVVAMAMTFPDINEVLYRMKGKLLPMGWWQFATKGRIMKRVRVGFLGVKPEFQHTGVAAKLYQLHFDAAERRPQKGGEMGWILETNTAMNRGMEAMGGKVVKRYRVYERDLQQAVPTGI